MKNLLDILFFITKVKWQKFQNVNKTLQHLLRLVLLIYVSILSFQVAFIYDYLCNNIINLNFSPEDLILSINIIVFALTILTEFFPRYKSRRIIIPLHYPVQNWKRIVAEIYYEITGYYYLVILISQITIFLFSENYEFLKVINHLLLILIAVIIYNCIKLIIENEVRAKSLFIIVLHLLIAAIAIIEINPPAPSLVWLVSLFFGFLFYYYILDSTNSGINLSNASAPKSKLAHSETYSSLILYHPRAKLISIFAFTAKVFMFIMAAIFLHIFPDQGIGISPFVFALGFMISPLTVFSIGYNVFGIYQDLWACIENNSGSPKVLFKMYTKILKPLFIGEILISLLFLVYLENKVFFIFYFFHLVLVIPFGFITSIKYPIKVNKKFQWGDNEFDIAGVLYSFIIFTSLLPLYNQWFYFIYLILLIILSIIFNKIILNYSAHKYKLYNELYKSN